MSAIRRGAPRIADIFAKGEPRHGARQRASSERRSSARPNFIDGWRKPLDPGFAPISQAMAPCVKNRIEIWVASTDGLLRSKSCLQLLTDKDWASLVRVQDPANRNSAISARVLLRLGLSRATDRRIAPAQWDFSVNGQQRPIVANGLPQIHYSVSHIDRIAVVAISPNLNVGIDVESVDQNVTENVMAEFCHLDEQRSLRGLTHSQKIREFIRLWTLKEAYTKMIGIGHSLDFKTIKFMLDPVTLVSGDDHRTGALPQFENFYVSVNHGLFHASLATQDSTRIKSSTEVQIISLAEASTGLPPVVPSCT
jgi:phosphopantetheinyl transferase